MQWTHRTTVLFEGGEENDGSMRKFTSICDELQIIIDWMTQSLGSSPMEMGVPEYRHRRNQNSNI